MTNKPLSGLVVLMLSLFLLAGCSDETTTKRSETQEETNPTNQVKNDSNTDSNANNSKKMSKPDTLPLLTIMVNLEQNMQSVSSGLWRHNFRQVSNSAESIANHARIPKTELGKIKGILGKQEFKAFVQDDKTVHEMAMKLSQVADDKNFEKTAQIYQKLEQGCISCHQKHRTKIRQSQKW